MSMKKALLASAFIHAAAGLGLYYGTADLANDNRPPPQPLSRTEQIIHTACTSKAPLLIVDTFSRHKPDYGFRMADAAVRFIDLDGDGHGDVAHGDMVRAVARTTGKETITYGLRPAMGHPDSIAPEEFTAALEDIVTKIKNHDMPKPAAVILSMAYYKNIKDINVLGRNDEEITPDNVGANAAAIQADVKQTHTPNHPYVRNINSMQALIKMGVPVFASAGNYGSPEYINMYATYGAITIGAKTYDGKSIAGYSDVNSLTTVYRQGDYIARMVDGGIDINGDETPEFPSKDLSSGIPLSVIYEEASADSALQQGLFSIAGGRHDKFGDLNHYGQVILTANQKPFRIDKNGGVYYDPAGNGDRAQVKLLRGTSYAAPAICGK